MEMSTDLGAEFDQFWKNAIKEVTGKEVLSDWSNVTGDDVQRTLEEVKRRTAEYIKRAHGSYDPTLD